MGVLRIDHPDVHEFITAKRTPGRWNNFNVSVGVSDAFMQALAEDGPWELIHQEKPGAAGSQFCNCAIHQQLRCFIGGFQFRSISWLDVHGASVLDVSRGWERRVQEIALFVFAPAAERHRTSSHAERGNYRIWESYCLGCIHMLRRHGEVSAIPIEAACGSGSGSGIAIGVTLTKYCAIDIYPTNVLGVTL